MLRAIFLGAAALCLSGPVLAQSLEAAVLPNARSVDNNTTATVFMSVLNSAEVDATNCSVASSARGSVPVDLNWTVLENGAPTGAQNAPFSVPGQGRTDLVLASTDANATYFDVGFRAVCDGGVESRVYAGVNTATLDFDAAPSDIIPIIATTSGDGVIRFDTQNKLAGFSIAAVNIGTERTIRVSGRRIGFLDSPTIRTRICETDINGVCLAERASFVDVTIGNTPRFFSFVVEVRDGAAPLRPDILRYEVQFQDQTTFSRSTTTAALYLPGAEALPQAFDLPEGRYDLQARNVDDATGEDVSPGHIDFVNGEIIGVLSQERTIGFVRQTFDQVFSLDRVPVQRIATAPDVDCGAAGTPLPENCLIRLETTAHVFDSGNDDAGTYDAVCTFDRDAGMTCDFSAQQVSGASSGWGRPNVIIGSDLTLFGAESIDYLDWQDLPDGVDSLLVTAFFRSADRLGDPAPVESDTGKNVNGDYRLDFELQGRGSIEQTIEFQYEGCTFTGYIVFYPITGWQGERGVMAKGDVMANCPDGSEAAEFWAGGFDFSGLVKTQSIGNPFIEVTTRLDNGVRLTAAFGLEIIQ